MYYEPTIARAEQLQAKAVHLKAKADKLFQKAKDVRDKTGDPKKYRWRFNKANHYYDVANMIEAKAAKFFADAAALLAP